MKICVVYDTKRGSTEKIARAIGEALQKYADVRVSRVTANLDVCGCDLLFLGAPIYYEKPLPGIKRFVMSHNGLEGKNVAVFILCMADRFGRFGKRYAEKRYMRLMTEGLKGRIISTKVFDGWLFGENIKTIKEAEKWALGVFKSWRRMLDEGQGY